MFFNSKLHIGLRLASVNMNCLLFTHTLSTLERHNCIMLQLFYYIIRIISAERFSISINCTSKKVSSYVAYAMFLHGMSITLIEGVGISKMHLCINIRKLEPEIKLGIELC